MAKVSGGQAVGRARFLRATRAAVLIGAGMVTALAGCAKHESVQMQALEVLSASTGVGRAPGYAVSRDGAEAILWVTAPHGGSQGTLRLVRGARTVTISDSLGAIEAHDESPPKLAFGRDSSALYVLYVVARAEAGRRFPAAALRFIGSGDGGATWSAPVTITDDAEFGSHNFHALHVANDGAVYVSWLDGRHGKSNVYVARSLDAGKTWATNVRVYEGEACPCCRTAMASDAKGNLYLAWRGVLPGNVRDIVVARSSDGGVTWNTPKRVHDDNWAFPGCPHAGPALQAGDDGRIHVAWWTGLEGKAGVYYAQSNNAGENWTAPVPIGVAEFSRPASVQLAVSGSGNVLVAWSDGTLEIPAIRLRLSADGGKTFGGPIAVSEPGRHAFFPALGVRHSSFAVLWSEQAPEHAKSEAASLPDMSDPNATMGLHDIGQTYVVMRRGLITGR